MILVFRLPRSCSGISGSKFLCVLFGVDRWCCSSFNYQVTGGSCHPVLPALQRGQPSFDDSKYGDDNLHSLSAAIDRNGDVPPALLRLSSEDVEPLGWFKEGPTHSDLDSMRVENLAGPKSEVDPTERSPDRDTYISHAPWQQQHHKSSTLND